MLRGTLGAWGLGALVGLTPKGAVGRHAYYIECGCTEVHMICMYWLTSCACTAYSWQHCVPLLLGEGGCGDDLFVGPKERAQNPRL